VVQPKGLDEMHVGGGGSGLSRSFMLGCARLGLAVLHRMAAADGLAEIQMFPVVAMHSEPAAVASAASLSPPLPGRIQHT
jgi:hypothetical protein